MSERDYGRALAARDPRFDGLFFVGITTTGIYCRPVCPARVTHVERRRFFESAAAAERAGFRPCMRCRPELAPGRAVIDSVSRLARNAAERIAAGALNGRSVAALADDLGVGERHLRRALEREIGVSPVELAQTHRLLLAKRLLTDTSLSVTRIAYASGFQSLRRFNAAFRERYRLAPSILRRAPQDRRQRSEESEPRPDDAIKLTLSYRPPLAWSALLGYLRASALPRVERVAAGRYTRIACVDGHAGMLAVEQPESIGVPGAQGHHLDAWVSQSLVPVIMPLLPRVRRMFDLDAEPAVIDAHLAQSGLGELVRRHPGLRVPTSLEGFDVAFRVLVNAPDAGRRTFERATRIIEELGQVVDSGDPRLCRCVPSASRIASAGTPALVELGLPRRHAEALVTIADAIVRGTLRLERGGDPIAARGTLVAIDGVDEVMAENIVMRALCWPDAFPDADVSLQVAARAASREALLSTAERWRPWRAYAALHLRGVPRLPLPMRERRVS